MTDMRCAPAPAGVFARGALDVRPAVAGVVPSARLRYAVVRTVPPFDLIGTAVAAPTAPFQETGLPAAGVFGTDALGTDALGTDALRTDITDKQHTLGIHPPGRPQS